MMAFNTRSDGGSGFSLEASLMTSFRPSSRSSSSIALPGSYGAIPRMWSLARDSQETCMRNSLRGRVGPEDLEELTAFLDFGQHVPDGLGVAVSLEVDEVHVLPRTPLRRPRLDLGQVQPALCER